MMPSSRHTTKIQHPGKGAGSGKSGDVEGTAVTGDLATTVGITLLSVITCCGEVVSFLM